MTMPNKLRVSINLGNPLLASKAEGPTAVVDGISVRIAQALASDWGLELELLFAEKASQSVGYLMQGRADVGFLAVDPVRANDLLFTRPYLCIEGGFLVNNALCSYSNVQIDSAALTIGVSSGSAYDLHLTRHIKQARIIRYENADEATLSFKLKKINVLAGISPVLKTLAAEIDDTCLLPESFMSIQQALAVNRNAGAVGQAALDQWIGELIAKGSVARWIEQFQLSVTQPK